MKNKMLLIFSIFFCFALADEFVESKTTVGGYGELHYDMEGNGGDGKLDFHRFIVYFKHNFNSQWSLMSEVEIEHNMVGSEAALGYKGGYVAMEQAYLNYWNGKWGFKGGVLLVPAGITNEYHEPPTFMSVERPEYNKYIIPTTWFDNGFAFYGAMGDFNWNFTMTGDLNGDEIGAGIRDARMKGFGSSTADWTKTIQASWTGMDGLKLGGSMTMNDAPRDDVTETTVTIEGVEGVAAHWDHAWTLLDGLCSGGGNDEVVCLADDTQANDFTWVEGNNPGVDNVCNDAEGNAAVGWDGTGDSNSCDSNDVAYDDNGTAWTAYDGSDESHWEHTATWVDEVVEIEEVTETTTTNPGPVGVKLLELNGTWSKNNLYARFEYGMIDYTNNPSGVKSSSGYYVDLGYNVADMMGCDGDLYLWTRSSSYSKDDDGDAKDISLFGVTYKPLNNVSFKFETGESGDADVMRMGLGYMF